MNGRNSSFARRQLIGARGIECRNDYAIMLNRFSIIKWRLTESRGIASFNPDDFRDAVRCGEFDLIGGQRRVFGIDIDIHCAEATAAFLTRRLLGAKRRWPEEKC